MRANRKKKFSRKHCLRTMSILLASLMLFTADGGQAVMAKQHETAVESSENNEQNQEQDKEQGREMAVVYLDGKKGKNKNSGEKPEEAVKSFKKAAELAGDYGIIYICGTVTVKKDEVWNLPQNVVIRRAKKFKKPLVNVKGSLILENVRMYAEDIRVSEEAVLEGAVEERPLVYVPELLIMDEPMEIGRLPLVQCEGKGKFTWRNGETIPSEYETECEVVFKPSNWKKVDYSGEEGWKKGKKRIIRKVTVRIPSLKPEEEPEEKPEVTPTPEPEEKPEVTPTPKPEEKPEVTPTPKPEEKPEVTPTPKPEEKPEVKPTPKPEEKPEVKPTPKPEEKPEVKPTPKPEEKPVLTEEEKTASYHVQDMISQLPAEIDSDEAVKTVVDVTKQYDALKKEQKELLAEEIFKKLAQAQEASAVYNRTSNDVTIEGEFPWYIKFLVELKNDRNDAKLLKDHKVDTIIAPYDMKLWDMMQEKEYELNGQQVKITVPAPDGKVYEKLLIVHYQADGTAEYITPTDNKNGTLSFLANSFSPYNLAGTKIAGGNSLVGNTDKVYEMGSSKPPVPDKKPSGNKKPSKPSGSKDTNRVPLTGDDQPVFLYIGVAAVALALLVIAVFMRKKK